MRSAWIVFTLEQNAAEILWVPEMLIRVKRRRRLVLWLVVLGRCTRRRPPLRDWSMI
jgi:hypothetical protein